MRGYRGEMTCTGGEWRDLSEQRSRCRWHRPLIGDPADFGLTVPPPGGNSDGVGFAAAACPAAGCYVRHRATMRWRGRGGPAMAFAHAERALGHFSLAPAQTG